MRPIDRPGVYEISAEAYHADPCPEPSLSASIAKILVNKTPLHAWTAHPRLNEDFEPVEEEKFDIGNACHSLILRDPKAFEIIHAPDWRTAIAREKREYARVQGKIPLLEDQWVRVEAMAYSARLQLSRHHEAKEAFTNGKPEQTLIWREGDAWCRARIDWLPNAGRFYDDYKSTAASADPHAYTRILWNIGHDIQAAFYRRGIKKLGLCDDPVFRFIVQETQTPHALSVIGLTPGALELADHKVARAIDIWQTCTRSNQWPGYSLRTCYAELPAWAEAQFMARDSAAHDMAREAYGAADEFNRPLEGASL